MTKEFGSLAKSYMDQLDPKIFYRTLGQQIGLPQSSISKVFSGNIEPKPDVAIRMADALKVPEEKRAEFLLLGGGFSLKTAREVLKQAGL